MHGEWMQGGFGIVLGVIAKISADREIIKCLLRQVRLGEREGLLRDIAGCEH